MNKLIIEWCIETQSDISIPKKLECFYGMEVKGVAWGEDHSFALINSGEKNKNMLWGWGMYKAGQLGLGNIKKKINPRLLQTLYIVQSYETIPSELISRGRKREHQVSVI